MESLLTPNILAVIMARAGSVGLKNKHTLPLLGRPVISYTFDHAIASKLITGWVVSSDSAEILSLATDAGFHTIQRPPHLATTEASVQSVLLHALQSIERDCGYVADAVVTLLESLPADHGCTLVIVSHNATVAVRAPARVRLDRGRVVGTS